MTTMAVNGATVAITGGTGSFGSTMTRHLLRGGAAQVNIFSRDEAKQDSMRQRLGDSRVRFFLGDVRDYDSVSEALTDVDFVFHAAALKQVPSCEFFPQQAVKTNVIGSRNVIDAAHRNGASSVVCLSTDKAVYPVNAMGMTKALMEKEAQAYSRNHPKSRTTVSVTRYGNVMYSRGSVIPLFVRQALSGEPLTLTHPRMTRFMMSLDESVDLVQHAFSNAEPGDLFVKKAPACTVHTVARAVAELLDVRNDIRTIGVRHGEKMYETLLSREEMVHAQDEGDYFRVPLDTRSLDYAAYVESGDTEEASDYDSNTTEQLDLERAKEMLSALPEMRDILEARA